MLCAAHRRGSMPVGSVSVSLAIPEQRLMAERRETPVALTVVGNTSGVYK